MVRCVKSAGRSMRTVDQLLMQVCDPTASQSGHILLRSPAKVGMPGQLACRLLRFLHTCSIVYSTSMIMHAESFRAGEFEADTKIECRRRNAKLHTLPPRPGFYGPCEYWLEIIEASKCLGFQQHKWGYESIRGSMLSLVVRLIMQDTDSLYIRPQCEVSYGYA